MDFSKSDRMIGKGFELALEQTENDYHSESLTLIDAGKLGVNEFEKLDEGFPVMILQGEEYLLTQRSPKSEGPIDNPARTPDKNIYVYMMDSDYISEDRLGTYQGVEINEINEKQRAVYRDNPENVIEYEPDEDLLREIEEFFED